MLTGIPRRDRRENLSEHPESMSGREGLFALRGYRNVLRAFPCNRKPNEPNSFDDSDRDFFETSTFSALGIRTVVYSPPQGSKPQGQSWMILGAVRRHDEIHSERAPEMAPEKALRGTERERDECGWNRAQKNNLRNE
ncbi:MAG: hypothetical protein RIR10_1075 [Planctomycetota bacterium]|jgi:hypothetical protein